MELHPSQISPPSKHICVNRPILTRNGLHKLPSPRNGQSVEKPDSAFFGSVSRSAEREYLSHDNDSNEDAECESLSSIRPSAIQKKLLLVENKLQAVFGDRFEAFREEEQLSSDDDDGVQGRSDVTARLKETRISWVEDQLRRIMRQGL
jgi:hypothetical protein